jgi:cytochrome c biogenesis protein CcmG/thiol:disulfide interchange protein DsbE
MPKGRFSLIVSSLLLIAFRISAGEFPDSWSWDDTPKDRAVHAALEGKPMRPLSVTGWINGTVTPEAMKGKVVVVDFYATWCGPCMAAIPHNNEMLAKYKDKGLLIVGVCTSSEGQEKMGEVVKAKGVKYPTALDPKLASERAWAVRYYPTYAVVDRKGIVRALGLQPSHVEAVVTKLLAE